MSAHCHVCKRTLSEGESAWAADWTVLDVNDAKATWRNEVRYTCDDCAKADTGSVAATWIAAACVVMALLFGAALVWPATFGLGAS